MDEDKKQEVTGAQLQIERLMRLKLEKDKKEKMRVENAGSDETALPMKKKAETPAQKEAAAARTVPALKRKAVNVVRIEKRVYEKLHKLVNALNITGGAKITKARFVNIILKEFLELGIDYSVISNDEEIKKLFGRLKQGN